ncbi:SprT family protein [Salinibacillus xinjiangensis]|uniref:Protein SprT-like n=1 Tax=Salinibacillus xinjiangensis TaxID=1229268 RepID=A0A6G1X8D7_9BACI|nr:SprT family protein [Salinibacillus xinjiangensis]MRG87207.1 SprT family protein [Salinibacillus xinjiangensis]
MDNNELTQLVNQLSIEYFHKPFVDQASFNGRLRTTGGRYLPSKRKIEINPKYLDELGMDELIGIIKHELCHYHLHIEGKGYQHRDRDFRELLNKTGSPRHCRALPSVRERTNSHTYKCTQCGHLYYRKRRVNVQKYRCGKCRGKLKKV